MFIIPFALIPVQPFMEHREIFHPPKASAAVRSLVLLGSQPGATPPATNTGFYATPSSPPPDASSPETPRSKPPSLPPKLPSIPNGSIYVATNPIPRVTPAPRIPTSAPRRPQNNSLPQSSLIDDLRNMRFSDLPPFVKRVLRGINRIGTPQPLVSNPPFAPAFGPSLLPLAATTFTTSLLAMMLMSFMMCSACCLFKSFAPRAGAPHPSRPAIQD